MEALEVVALFEDVMPAMALLEDITLVMTLDAMSMLRSLLPSIQESITSSFSIVLIAERSSHNTRFERLLQD